MPLQFIQTNFSNKLVHVQMPTIVFFFAEIFETLMTTPRDTLRLVADELLPCTQSLREKVGRRL